MLSFDLNFKAFCKPQLLSALALLRGSALTIYSNSQAKVG